VWYEVQTLVNEELNLLGHDAMFFGKLLQTIQTNLLPPFSV